MKKHILILLAVLLSFTAYSQTSPTLPTGAKPYGNQLYIVPATGDIWGGNAGYSYRVVAKKSYLDSLINLNYKKTQIDSLLALKADITYVNDEITNTVNYINTGLALKENAIVATTSADYYRGDKVFAALNKTAVGLPNVDNTSDANKPVSAATQTALDLKINSSLIGVGNGVATLDAGGKVPLSQTNDALIGSVNYQGNYNAATNSPALPTATGNKGKYYVISAAGTQQGLNFVSGDWIISNGVIWEKVDNNNSVTSVNGKVGAVTINATDVNAIQNQSTVSQNANFRISGNGRVGSLSIGEEPSPSVGLWNRFELNGAAATMYSDYVLATIRPGVLSANLRFSNANFASGVTLSSLNHNLITQGTISSGTTIETQTGYWADNTLIGATNNYAFRGSIPVGAGRYNLYMDGLGSNYLAGRLGLGVVDPFSALDIGTGAFTSRESATTFNQILSNNSGLHFNLNAGQNNTIRNFIWNASTSGGAMTERMRLTSTGLLTVSNAQVSSAPTNPTDVVRLADISSFLSKAISNPTNGVLITTSIPANIGAMFFAEINVNTYLQQTPAKILINGYSSAAALEQVKALSMSGDFTPEISVFADANNFIAFWFAQGSSQKTFFVDVKRSNIAENAVTSVTNVAKPTNITREVTIIPTRTLIDNGLATNLILGNGAYKPISDFATTSDVVTLTTPQTITGLKTFRGAITAGLQSSSIGGTVLLKDNYTSGGSIYTTGVVYGSGDVYLGKGLAQVEGNGGFISTHAQNTARSYIRLTGAGVVLGLAPVQSTTIGNAISGLLEYPIWTTKDFTITDVTNWNNKQNAVTLTTTGSGVPTFNQSTGVLNIPNQTVINTTTTELSLATLNSIYPTATTGFRVICHLITGAPAIYTKATGSIWLTENVTITP